MPRKWFAALLSILMFATFSATVGATGPDAGISAAKRADSEVSIEVWPKGVFGFVESGREGCEVKRQVRVFKKTGNGKLRALGSGRTIKSDNGFTWSLKNRRATSGTVVAKAAETGRCAADSVRKRIPLNAGDPPLCPSKEDVCQLQWMKIEDDTHYDVRACRRFGEPYGNCKIEVTRGRVPFCCFATGWVRWDRKSAGRRDFEFFSEDYIPSGSPRVLGPHFTGWLPNDSSADFNVTEAVVPRYFDDPNAAWYTPTLPDTHPGTNGGPLWINWSQGASNSFNFYIAGFLYKKK